jgi:hypothetical protein
MAPAPAQQDFPAHVLETCAFIRATGEALRQYLRPQKGWDFHLGRKQLAGLNVRCTPLDLQSSNSAPSPGDSSGTGFQFVRPIPIQTMHDWLEKSRPWDDNGYSPLSGRTSDDGPFRNAGYMAGQLSAWVNPAFGADGQAVLEYKTMWWSNMATSHAFMKSKWSQGGASFKVESVFDNVDDKTDLKGHTSKPHIVGVLQSDSRMREGGLLVSEVVAILQLTGFRFLNGNTDHRIVPVSPPVVPGRSVRASETIWWLTFHFDGRSL